MQDTPIRVEIVRTIGEMENHKAAWSNLFQEAMFRSIGAEPDFCINWCQHFGRNKDWAPRGNSKRKMARPARPFLVMGWNAGRLDVVLPFRIVPTRASYMHGRPYPRWLGSIPTQSLQGFINAHSLTTGILIRKGSSAFGHEIIRRTLSSSHWQTIDLGLLPASTDFAQLIQGAVETQAAPLPDELFRDCRVIFDGDYQAFLAQRSSLRKSQRRTRKRLESEYGSATLKCWSGRDALTDGFSAFLEVDGQSWKATEPGGETLNGDATIRNYYAGLLARFAAMGRAHVFGLFLGDSLAAATLCLESDGVLYSYKTSYKEAFACLPQCRPGAAMYTMLVEQAWNRYAALDFLNHYDPDYWHGQDITFARARYVASSRWRRLAFR